MAFFALLLSVGACGGGSSSPDGGGDAATSRDGSGGAPDASAEELDGTFHLTSSTTPDQCARWTFHHATGMAAQAWWYPTQPTADAEASAYLAPFTFDGTHSPLRGLDQRRDLGAGDRHADGHRRRAENITIEGRIALGDGVPDLSASPRVAMIGLVFDEAGAMTYTQVRTEEPTTDQALVLTPTQVEATFTMQRSAAPLARELTSYGAATVAFEGFVVYDERDGVAGLGSLDDTCTISCVDCVRALAPMFLTYRDGTASELEASAYGDLAPGWNLAALSSIEDAGIGLASLPVEGGLEGGPSPLIEVSYAPGFNVRFER